MARARVWGCSLLGAVGLACAPVIPPERNASDLGDPSMAAPDELAISRADRPEPPSVPAPEAPPLPPRDPVSTAGCPMKWTPAPLHGGVLHLPKEIAGRFMIPLYEAACACTRPGDHLSLVARIVPERGEITITTARRDDPKTRDEPSVDACFAMLTKDKPFETFELGSDVVCPDQPQPKPHMGPPFFRAPRLVGCGKPATSLIVYPLIVDRRNEG
jgi:hypothetical protein